MARAVGMAEEDGAARTELVLGDVQRAQHVVADGGSRVPDDVRLAQRQPERPQRVHASVHARDHGDLARRLAREPPERGLRLGFGRRRGVGGGGLLARGPERLPAEGGHRLQGELLVRHRLERHAVQRRDAQLLDRRAVLGRRVADVGRELPARVLLLHPHHEAVTRDLRDHGRGGDRGAHRVAAHHRALLEARRRHGEPVGQAQGALAPDPPQHVAERGQVGLVQAPLVDPADAAGGDGHLRRGAQHLRVQRLAHLHRVLLGVVERRQRPQLGQRQRLVVEQHGSRDERAGEAPAARLVGARDEAVAERAVVTEETAAARPPPPARPARLAQADGRRAHGLRGVRCAWEASRWRRLRR